MNRSLLHDVVRSRIQSSIAVKQDLLADLPLQRALVDISLQIVKSLHSGGKVFFFGNGGSAADAQHLAAEFTGRYLKERPSLPALALNANTSAITAIGNDYGFDLVFARQLEGLGRAGDVAIGITTSGGSLNVIRALEAARAKSMFTAAFTGASGGAVRKVAECTVCIPSCETPRIQEGHILAGHIVCEIVEHLICEDHDLRTTESHSTRAFAAAVSDLSSCD